MRKQVRFMIFGPPPYSTWFAAMSYDTEEGCLFVARTQLAKESSLSLPTVFYDRAEAKAAIRSTRRYAKKNGYDLAWKLQYSIVPIHI